MNYFIIAFCIGIIISALYLFIRQFVSGSKKGCHGACSGCPGACKSQNAWYNNTDTCTHGGCEHCFGTAKEKDGNHAK